jgi:PAS domain S-box-containing protein
VSVSVKHGVLSTASNQLAKWLLLLCLAAPPAFPAPGQPPKGIKRVLLLYSENVRLPFAQVQDEVFHQRLSDLRQTVDVFSENFDSSLLGENPPDTLVADYYRQKYKNIHFDVLIAIKSSALRFLLARRADTFGNAPVVFCNLSATDQALNQLTPGVTGVETDYSPLPSLDLIRRLQPDTRRVVMIVGEEAITTNWRRNIASFAAHTPVDLWIGLTPEELDARLAALPAQTAVLYVSERTDRLGHSFVPRDLLSRISSRSTAPVYSIATTYLGTGTVGGRLIDPKIDAGMATDLAERILNDENPENMKPVIEPPRYAFDSRVLERFHIPEGRLPAGSEVLFREPTAWERYRSYILAAVFFLLMETALVAMLLLERRRAKQAKSLLERRFSIERIISECSTKLSECSADKVDDEIKRGLRALLDSEGADRASWFVMDDSGVGVRNMISVHLPGVSPEPAFYNRPELPWITAKLLSGQSVVVATLHDLPPEAQADRSYLEEQETKSLAFVPFSHAAARGVLVLVRLTEPGEWPAALTDRLEVLGNIFANALMRKQAQEARQESEERFRYLFTEAPIGIALEDLEGGVLFANPALCSMLGYTPEELTSMNCSQFADPEDEQEDWEEFQAMRAGAKRSYQVEKRYRRKDGSRMWGRLNVSKLNSSGRPTLVLATVEDITDKRAALEDLQRAHTELQQLTRRLISAQEAERLRISSELHDDVGQRLSLLMVNLDVLQNQMPIERAAEQAEIGKLLRELDELVTDVHNMSHQLHSSKLDHLGLSAALKELCRQLAGRHHTEINLTTDQVPQSLSEEVSLCFYRVAQEALTNAVKHSRSSRVDVAVLSNDRVLSMRIRDFGVGFDPQVPKDGLGLVTMQERLKMIGGVLRFNSVPGRGTELEAEANINDARLPAQAA